MVYTLEANGVYLLGADGKPKRFATWECARAADRLFSDFNGRIHAVPAKDGQK